MTFEEAYRAWRSQPFPSGSHDDQIDDIHAQLAYVDAVVADVVIPFVESGRDVSVKLDVAALLNELSSRIAAHDETVSARLDGRLAEYQHYCDLLRSVYELAPKEVWDFTPP